jgi:hypothetical protein
MRTVELYLYKIVSRQKYVMMTSHVLYFYVDYCTVRT